MLQGSIPLDNCEYVVTGSPWQVLPMIMTSTRELNIIGYCFCLCWGLAVGLLVAVWLHLEPESVMAAHANLIGHGRKAEELNTT